MPLETDAVLRAEPATSVQVYVMLVLNAFTAVMLIFAFLNLYRRKIPLTLTVQTLISLLSEASVQVLLAKFLKKSNSILTVFDIFRTLFVTYNQTKQKYRPSLYV